MILTPLGKTILLDRYALKDPNRNNIDIGDTVIFVSDTQTGGRNIGVVKEIRYRNG